MTDYIIERYFRHPSYWRIDGRPYFSVYELYRLGAELWRARGDARGAASASATRRARPGFPGCT